MKTDMVKMARDARETVKLVQESWGALSRDGSMWSTGAQQKQKERNNS